MYLFFGRLEYIFSEYPDVYNNQVKGRAVTTDVNQLLDASMPQRYFRTRK